jgi:predicted nuclease with TOPRIM domain
MNEKENISTVIKGIEFKTRKLTDLLTDVKKENARLTEENETLKKNVTEQQLKTNFLEDRITIIKAAKVLRREDAGDTKSKVNELLREIDRCIGLLNTNDIEP